MAPLSFEKFNELDRKYQMGEATARDLELLEPYKAKRAVLLASGFGSRMLPITINTPKPMVNVNGKRIIDSLLDALIAIDIKEIVIVTGYLSEQFELLKTKYPTIRLIENPAFAITNNISSACTALKFNSRAFENAYVFESDLLLKNPSLIKKYRYCCCYVATPVEETQDWCFEVADGVITDLHKGGTNCYQMYGISYWTQEGGERLAEDLPACYADKGNLQRFWDDVPCVIRQQNYRLYVDECSPDDVWEIDSLAELQELDKRYKF